MDEADGTNETRRQSELETAINKTRRMSEPEPVVFGTATPKPDVTAEEILAYNRARAKEWEAKGRLDWHIAELEASIGKL